MGVVLSVSHVATPRASTELSTCECFVKVCCINGIEPGLGSLFIANLLDRPATTAQRQLVLYLETTRMLVMDNPKAFFLLLFREIKSGSLHLSAIR